MHRSHTTQELLNYFDESDVRTRETPWTIEAQLLNAAACAIDEADVRLSREADSVRPGRVPLNLDNRGVWRRVQVPYGMQAVSSVTGVRDGHEIALRPYDPFFPVPSGIAGDPDREIVPLADPLLWAFNGNGLPLGSGPLKLAVPNRVWFTIEALDSFDGLITIAVTGHRHPRSLWVSDAEPRVETLTVHEEGVYSTAGAWDEILDVSVRGLPSGASLKVYLFLAGKQPDLLRPYTSPAFRDRSFGRFWSAEGSYIRESFFAARFSGFEICQTYFRPDAVSVSVEPNTYGLLVATPDQLLFCDRREPVPAGLARAALTEEPLYGLEVSYDLVRSGDRRWVSLRPIPYVGAPQLTQFRYTVEDPAGRHWILTRDGEMAQWSPTLGWLRGVPGELSLSLPETQCGTWLFALETIDQSGHLSADKAPYLHAALAPLVSFDLTGVAPQLAAAWFDSRERLWLWTGDLLIPAVFRYDSYVFDADSQSVYLTDSYDEVRLA